MQIFICGAEEKKYWLKCEVREGGNERKLARNAAAQTENCEFFKSSKQTVPCNHSGSSTSWTQLQTFHLLWKYKNLAKQMKLAKMSAKKVRSESCSLEPHLNIRKLGETKWQAPRQQWKNFRNKQIWEWLFQNLELRIWKGKIAVTQKADHAVRPRFRGKHLSV